MAIGKVIKGDVVNEPAGEREPTARPRAGVVNAEVYNAHQSAQQILENAKRQAQELLQEAKERASKVLGEAREAGRQEGLAKVTELLLKARIQREALIASAEQEIVALALKVAEKIIGTDLQRSPEVLMNICATAIENARAAKELTLRVNPRDVAILRERRREMMELIGRTREVAIKEDPDVAPHGCILETEAGVIDAQLPTQLEMILQVLTAADAKKENP